MNSPQNTGGLPYALGAYFLWGLLPLYLRLVHDTPPLEFVGYRTLFTLPICALLIAAVRQTPDLITAITTRRTLALLTLSSGFIAANWLIYVFAIQAGHIFAASLGYYINPLMNVVLGTIFLGERLSRGQWLAVALATLGVAILATGAGETLLVSLVLAASFSLYGLVRKHTPVPALTGLTIEASILALPACAFIAYGHGPSGIALSATNLPHTALIAASGLVTAIPLILFATAARRMNYSILGFIQFLAPTLVFFQGLLLFHEPLRPIQLASFILIWAALAVFCWDLWRASRAKA